MFKKLREYDFRKLDLGLLIAAIILGVIGAYMLKIIPGVLDAEEKYMK